MRSFFTFGFPAVLALVLSGPVIPYLWKKEKASSIMLSAMALLVIALCAFTWHEYVDEDW